MKRILILAGVLVGGCLPVQSQPTVSMGPLLAPFSSYAGEPRQPDASFRYSTGIALGLQAQIDFTKKWSITSGFWYETASVKAGDGIFSSAYRINQRNIAIPLLLNFRPADRKVSPYFSGGTLLVSKREEQGLIARLLLAAGLSYRINTHLTFNVQPALTLGAPSKLDRTLYPSNRQLSLQAQLLYQFSTRTDE
ncbi:hypothetical protein [Salmonirosea aquatica]|uniref:Outer membrane beta-barrel protein n=1 Tax=Salmonirosea aquatica TaxID=2654236 RepID=A0A7C9BLS3_9BACT|nr:hypothetical protein [Cytophagaceae bacterium SJW1-29]